MKPIRIVLDGGLVQEIHNIPGGVTIEVYDYDVQDSPDDDPKITTDEKGKRVYVTTWEGE